MLFSHSPGETPPNWSVAYLLWFCYAATLAIRCKYYLAWLLADVICNNAGIGFQSPGKWDRVTNVDIIGFEVITLIIVKSYNHFQLLLIKYVNVLSRLLVRSEKL